MKAVLTGKKTDRTQPVLCFPTFFKSSKTRSLCLFSKLKSNRLVKSSRGANGGYVLDKPASEIKLSNIIFAVDEEVKTLNCKKNSKRGCNNRSVKCITHNLWDQLDQHINGFFEKVKLQDLAKTNQKQL